MMIFQITTSLLQDSADFIFFTLLIMALCFRVLRYARIKHFQLTDHQYDGLFIYVAIAWFMLRAIFWSYYVYEASVSRPQGSFRMNSALHSIHEAKNWRFPNLHWLIRTHWLLTNETQPAFSKPIPQDAFLRMTNGALEAERFRNRLINNKEKPLTSLIDAILVFKSATQPSLSGAYSLDEFDISDKQLLSSIKTTSSNQETIKSFEAFSGSWYGLWDNLEVDHQWSKTETYSPPYIIEEDETRIFIHALQYAWIGDGFGWNLSVSLEPFDLNTFILGAVYHVKDQNPQNVYLYRPHVGISTGENLIWITENEVFFEQAYLENRPQQYAITGFTYQWMDSKVQIDGDGFQAIYSRNPDERVPWKRIPLNP